MCRNLPNQMLVPRIIRMHRNSRISQHRLRSCCRNNDPFMCLLNLVCETCQHTKFNGLLVTGYFFEDATFDFFVIDFFVGECSVELTTPVDKSGGSVDETFFMETDECFFDGT